MCTITEIKSPTTKISNVCQEFPGHHSNCLGSLVSQSPRTFGFCFKHFRKGSLSLGCLIFSHTLPWSCPRYYQEGHCAVDCSYVPSGMGTLYPDHIHLTFKIWPQKNEGAQDSLAQCLPSLTGNSG